MDNGGRCELPLEMGFALCPMSETGDLDCELDEFTDGAERRPDRLGSLGESGGPMES